MPHPSSSSPTPIKKQRLGEKYCQHCNIYIDSVKFSAHLKHKGKLETKIGNGVSILQQIYKNRIIIYKIEPGEEEGQKFQQVSEFLGSVQTKILELIRDNLLKHGNLKINLELYGIYLLVGKETEEREIKSFNTKMRVVSISTNLEEEFSHFMGSLEKKTSEFNERKSGKFSLSLSSN